MVLPLWRASLVVPDDFLVLLVGVDDEREDAEPEELLAAGRPLYQPADDGPDPQQVALPGGHHVYLSLLKDEIRAVSIPISKES